MNHYAVHHKGLLLFHYAVQFRLFNITTIYAVQYSTLHSDNIYSSFSARFITISLAFTSEKLIYQRPLILVYNVHARCLQLISSALLYSLIASLNIPEGWTPAFQGAKPSWTLELICFRFYALKHLNLPRGFYQLSWYTIRFVGLTIEDIRDDLQFGQSPDLLITDSDFTRRSNSSQDLYTVSLRQFQSPTVTIARFSVYSSDVGTAPTGLTGSNSYTSTAPTGLTGSKNHSKYLYHEPHNK